MRILTIDDSTEHLDIITDTLSNESYKVTPCSDSYKALQILSENAYDCIILDLVMPFLEGKHLLTVLHEKYPDIPIIVFSAHIENEAELIEKGAFAVIPKQMENLPCLVTSVDNAIHDAKKSVTFIFNHTDLKKVKNTVVSRLVALALQKAKGNQVKASALLGISRQALIRYMKKYKIAAR